MPTILIGSDGSAQAENALRFGGALARALDARVGVVSAYAHTPPTRGDAGGFDVILQDDAWKFARRGAAAIEGVREVKPLVSAAATVSEALHTAAIAQQADLLVVASSGRRRIAGHQLGSVAEAVVHHSPCPVAVVPPQDGEPQFTRIGVAVDGSDASRRALDFALQLGESVDRETVAFRLLHVIPSTEHVPQPGNTIMRFGSEQLEAIAVDAAARGEVKVVERMGDPAKELLRMSKRLDLLVTGSRDRGAVKRLVLGSVSTRIVRNPSCPVIVVPAFATASLAGDAAAAEPTSA